MCLKDVLTIEHTTTEATTDGPDTVAPGVTALAGALEALSFTLTALNVAHNRINANGAKLLAEAIRYNDVMQYMDVSNNRLMGTGDSAADGLMELVSAATTW